MKKILFSFVTFIFLLISGGNQALGYSAISASKSQIDNITCDLNFTGTLRQGFAYDFSDNFTNPSGRDVKLDEVKVTYYEESDFNGSANFPSFSFTPWINNKNSILNPGDSGLVTESASKYPITGKPTSKNGENFKIAYTAKFFYKEDDGNFSDGPYYHTECKDYSVSWCGDGIKDSSDGEKCDPNDSSKSGWGANGCTNLCEPDERTCDSNTISKTEVFTGESSIVTCVGTNAKKITIDCGNGDTYFQQNQGDGEETFSHFCQYDEVGTYITKCIVDEIEPSSQCIKTLEVKEQPETYTPEPACTGVSASIKVGTEKLDTSISCSGKDVSVFKIDCGNGKTYSKNGSGVGTENFSHSCSYNNVGNYTAKCSVDNFVSPSVCHETLEVKEQSETYTPQPACTGVTASIKVGTENLDTRISCSGKDVSVFKIDCGNGKTYSKNGSGVGTESFSHSCSYNNVGNYIAKCSVDNFVSPSVCHETLKVKEQPETYTLQPACTGVTASIKVGTENLDTRISCSGKDVSVFKIDCGNGKTYSKNGSGVGTESFSHSCSYNNVGNYTAKCSVDNFVSPNVCHETLEIKKGELIEEEEIEEEITLEPEVQPVCNGLYLQKNSGVGILETKVACIGTGAQEYVIDCGNGEEFSGVFSSKAQSNALHTCIYKKTGLYTPSCSVKGAIINSACSKKAEVIKEDISEWENSMKKIYNHYENLNEELRKIELEEKQQGIGIITLPKILPRTGTPIEERTHKQYNSSIELELDESRFQLAGEKNEDIDFWKTALDERERDANKYIVIPSNGLVIPINDIPTDVDDYKTLISGREIELNKYLKTGAMEYNGTSVNSYGEVGNKVVFAHSSYWKKDDGRYKTDFQKIIELNEGEEIWVYEKKNGRYERFKYKTELSYNTLADDIDVLKPGIGKNLTLFTCTPIGGIEGRWVIKAKYIDDKKIYLEEKLLFRGINRDIKIKARNFLSKLGKLNTDERNTKILKIFKLLSIKEKTIKNKEIQEVFEYLKYKLAMMYYQN